MSHAERCPVCYGSGKLDIRESPHGSTTAAGSIQTICQGCGGSGWIEVKELLKEE